jgi:hypothetical protein
MTLQLFSQQYFDFHLTVATRRASSSSVSFLVHFILVAMLLQPVSLDISMQTTE